MPKFRVRVIKQLYCGHFPWPRPSEIKRLRNNNLVRSEARAVPGGTAPRAMQILLSVAGCRTVSGATTS